MRNSSISDTYREILSNIEGINDSEVDKYAEEFARRQKRGWTLPITTYRRCKDILYYKESLSRNSPYYVDLLKIEDRNNLKVVLLDLIHTIRIKENKYN